MTRPETPAAPELDRYKLIAVIEPWLVSVCSDGNSDSRRLTRSIVEDIWRLIQDDRALIAAKLARKDEEIADLRVDLVNEQARVRGWIEEFQDQCRLRSDLIAERDALAAQVEALRGALKLAEGTVARDSVGTAYELTLIRAALTASETGGRDVNPR